jgi:phosphoglycolate phosphatase
MKYHKPDPRAFDSLLEENSLEAQECVYVGDSLGDAAAAKGAKLHFIASLESGLKSREDFSGYPVDAFIGSFPELAHAVHTLESSLS